MKEQKFASELDVFQPVDRLEESPGSYERLFMREITG